MDIVTKVKALLTSCPYMSEFTGGIDVDYTENTIGAFGMYSNGDSLESTDVTGGENRRHNFVLYAVNQPISNYQRLENTAWLLNLGYWLDAQRNVPIIDDGVEIGVIKSLAASNAMVFDVPTGDIKDGVRYQVQLSANYYLNP